jgi:hypothetical protein
MKTADCLTHRIIELEECSSGFYIEVFVSVLEEQGSKFSYDTHPDIKGGVIEQFDRTLIKQMCNISLNITRTVTWVLLTNLRDL